MILAEEYQVQIRDLADAFRREKSKVFTDLAEVKTSVDEPVYVNGQGLEVLVENLRRKVNWVMGLKNGTQKTWESLLERARREADQEIKKWLDAKGISSKLDRDEATTFWQQQLPELYEPQVA